MSENRPLSNRLRILVVDDEQPARKRIVSLLRTDPDVAEIFEARDGSAAVDMIQERQPDIVFLDIQMPGVTGFGVIHALDKKKIPLTIFVTAHDQYAIDAFEADAVDYLLKPFGSARFKKALARAKMRLKTGDEGIVGPNVLQLAVKRAEPGEIWEWLVVKHTDYTKFVAARDVEWIEAAGVYVYLHVGNKSILFRAALGELTKRLDPFLFVRIHKSTTINIRYIDRLEPASHGEFDVIMKDGSQLHLSRSFRGELTKMLGQPL